MTEFNYRISDERVAHVFVGLAIQKRDEADASRAASIAHGFATVDLTDDELAKQHIRHMVGGRSELARDERLFRFVFPERPGALMQFLSSMHPEWNISLFHYRNQGADYGRILVGIQVPGDRRPRGVPRFLADLAYPCVDETGQPGLPAVPALIGRPAVASARRPAPQSPQPRSSRRPCPPTVR